MLHDVVTEFQNSIDCFEIVHKHTQFWFEVQFPLKQLYCGIIVDMGLKVHSY